MNLINDYRWEKSDQLFQKLSTISGPLSSLGECTHILPPVIISSIFSNRFHNPLHRFLYMVVSNVAIKILHDFGDSLKSIWVKKKIKQIGQDSKSGNKKKKLVYVISSFSMGLVFRSTNFFNFRTKSNLERLSKLFEITLVEAKTKEQLETEISQLEVGSLDAVIVQAHGNQNVIAFSKDNFVEFFSLEIFKTLAKKLKEGSKLSLISCYTGKGVENIAKEISKLCSKSKVYCPTDKYSVGDSESYKLLDDASCSFLDQNWFSGLFEERKDITKVYQDGQVVQA